MLIGVALHVSQEPSSCSPLHHLPSEFSCSGLFVLKDSIRKRMTPCVSHVRPVGGHVLAHASATRLQLRKGRAEERVLKIMDSPDVAEGEASYKLSAGGWEDV